MNRKWAVFRVKSYSQPNIILRYERFLHNFVGDVKDFYFVSYRDEKGIQRIVLPGYLFLKPGSDFDFLLFLKLEPYVYRVYRSGDSFLTVSDKEINELRNRVNDFVVRKKNKNLEVGDKVYIVDGFFNGYYGDVIEVRKYKVIVLIDFNYFSMKLEVPRNWVDVVDGR